MKLLSYYFIFSKPRPFLTAGTWLEVGLVEDLDRDTVKGVAGRVVD